MEKKWWHNKVAYQIYPKSFCDTDGDGIGDINGIISKLDYLKELGVDIVWISPIYKSPFIDQGYDISNYYAIDEKFGTMEDFDRLLAESKKRGMYILMDLVVNHCSSEHEWFKRAMADPEGKYGDYFYLKEGKDGKVPTNYRSYFGGSVWEPVPNRENLFYLHSFAKRQPDLNWENPEVRSEIYKMMNWWLDKGLSGFRIDAIINIKKNLEWKDYEPDEADGTAFVTKNVEDAWGVGEFLQEMKHETFDPHDAFTVGEVFNMRPSEMVDFVGDNGHFSTMFDFTAEVLDTARKEWTDGTKIDFSAWRDAIFKSQEQMYGIGFLANIIENHDEPRGAFRYLPDWAQTEAGKKTLATQFMFLRGIPFVYQGQEIGMMHAKRENISEYDDISTHDRYKKAIRQGLSVQDALDGCYRYSRDNARTPVQWDDSENAGFSKVKPWQPVNPDYRDVNVAKQSADENSLLSYYKKLIALRKNPEWEDAIVYGKTIPLFTDTEGMFAYERIAENGQKILVLCNFSKSAVQLNLKEEGLEFSKVLISNMNTKCGEKITLKSLECCILG